VQYGLSDGTVSQLVSGDLKAGDQIVTNIIVPQTSAQRQQNNLLAPQGRGNFGGLQPGGLPGGGFGGQGGGGNFGGGGGGGGRRGGD
jgi:hypothetical protein